ncbi:MAG: oxidoreductase [Candidatus Marinimicrobia bacterium]|nr:oxidoreductase [Candidatus Neomarinimicrobiota bacterium]
MSYKPKTWIKGKFKTIDKITDLTWIFVIELEEPFEYKAGQFVNIKVNGVTRSYSIASYDSGKNTFELLIVKLEGGALTTMLFDQIKEGDPLEAKGPYGHFLLPNEIENDLFFICTGTGLAPFRSMLDLIIQNKIPHRKIYLIFGTRTRADLLCFDEINKMKESVEGLVYVPVLSREEWDGATGYVHKHYKKIIQDEELKDPIFYLCGWRDMILESRSNLKDLGYDTKKIICEIYD